MNIKTSIITAIIIAHTFLSNCFAAIPDGDWCILEGNPGEYYGSNNLNISFDLPEKQNGKIVYGSYEESWEGDEGAYYDFGKPVINGNKATFKAYECGFDWNPKTEKVIKKHTGKTEDCTLTYDEITKTVTLKIGAEIEFKESNKCNFIAIDGGNNINVRKSPVTGEKIGQVTKGQILPLLSISSAPNYGEKWYEVKLPDGKTGFVSSKFVRPVSKELYMIPDMYFEPNIYFEHAFDDSDPNNVRLQTVSFKRKGNKVMCHDFTGFPLVFRFPWDFYGMGVIEGNKIIINKNLGMNEGREPYENTDFTKFEKNATEVTPEIWYYMNGCIFNGDGMEFNWQIL